MNINKSKDDSSKIDSLFDIVSIILIKDIGNLFIIWFIWYYNKYYEWAPLIERSKWFCLDPIAFNLIVVVLLFLWNMMLIGIIHSIIQEYKKDIREFKQKKE